MNGLSGEQDRIFRFIGNYIEVTGESPTVREIRVLADVSSLGQVFRQLEALREAGLVTWRFRRARSIRVVGKNSEDRIQKTE